MARPAKLPRGISLRKRTRKLKDGTTTTAVTYRAQVGWTRKDPTTGGEISTMEELGEFATLEPAKEALKKARGELAVGTFIPPKEIRRQARENKKREEALAVARKVTVTSWSTQWLAALEAEGRASSTVMSYRSILNAHVLPHLGNMPLADVTSADIDNVVQAASAKSIGAGRNTGVALRAMFNRAVEDGAGGVEVSPVRVSIPKSRPRSDEEIPGGDQVQALVDAAPVEIKLGLVLAAKLGLRFGEVLGLQRRDFKHLGDPGRATLTVARQWASKGSVLAPTKGKLARTIPLSVDLVSIVEWHLGEFALAGSASFVFPGVVDKTRCMTPKAFTDRLKLARERSGCDFTMHTLRHYALSSFHASGAGIRDAASLAGHANVAVTERYLHSDAERQRLIVEAGRALKVNN